MATVGFIGLGKLGLPVAETMAAHGHDVRGYDRVSVKTDQVNYQPDISHAVRECEFIFIAVPTPHHPDYDGSKPSSHLLARDFNYDEVLNVLYRIQPHLVAGQTVVLISTCLPGTTEKLFAPLIPAGVNLVYTPYFIAMGTVEQDFLFPEFMLLGTRTGRYDDDVVKLVEFYESMMPIGNHRFRAMTWNEAECTKVFYNTWISWKIAFVNMIQEVSECIGNMDVDRVTEALCLGDQRLFTDEYMTAGMGDGGPCHPRDNIALSKLARDCGMEYDLFHTIMLAREKQAENLGLTVADLAMDSRNDVVIIGKSFKPDVPYTDGSYALLVAHYIEEEGVTVHWHDPNTGDVFAPEDNKPYVYLLSHGDTYEIEFSIGSIVVDPWRTLEPISGVKIVRYGDSRPTSCVR